MLFRSHNVLFEGIKNQKEKIISESPCFEKIEGAQYFSSVELIDQSPIGRSSRSNPITYLQSFDLIRDLFARTQQSKSRGFAAGQFSFNVPGGRCEACEGEGVQRIEMQFLAQAELQCDVCQGKRYKKEILNIRFNDKNIFEVLQLTASEAIRFFSSFGEGKKLAHKLQILEDVGLGYVQLGQSATTLSGGEAQRMKLASFLSESDTKTSSLFIFDEPTTGLHFDDVSVLLHCFNKLIHHGHSLIIIEHNMDVIKCADWVIDMGPEAGEKGGTIVAEGTPETVSKVIKSFTGKFLSKVLND